MPGQFGPINVLEDLSSIFFTLTISLTGIPSEIQTINSISCSIASIIAFAANLGGTNIAVALISNFSFAS